VIRPAGGARPGARPGDTGGGAYVEFIIAIMPMMILFCGIMQLNALLLADLVVRDAAVNAVRAAIVCDSQVSGPEDESTLEAQGGCSWEAASDTLGAMGAFGTPPVFSVDVSGASPHGNEPVTATVTATFHCTVPLVGDLVCGGLGSGATSLARRASLPNQGVNYAL
jgi:Flp pilus assembly protein TadG